MHNDGCIDDFNSKRIIEDFVKKSKNIEIGDFGFIDATIEFCFEAIKKVDEFFLAISSSALNIYSGNYSDKNLKNINLNSKK